MNISIQSPEHQWLGRAVRLLRAHRRLSQEELGYRASLHRNYVGAIERGEINPTFRVLLNVCDGLDVPLSRLISVYERLRRPGEDPLGPSGSPVPVSPRDGGREGGATASLDQAAASKMSPGFQARLSRLMLQNREALAQLMEDDEE
jgi:transcriptional regulator with XRE-family HTH domain